MIENWKNFNKCLLASSMRGRTRVAFMLKLKKKIVGLID